MKLGLLIEQFRIEADDTASPYLWSDAELTRYAVEAEHEACRRALLLADSRTESVCVVAVVSGTHSYTLDPRILRVRRVKLDSQRVPLRRRTMAELDHYVSGWESHTGRVEAYMHADQDTGTMRLYRTPTAADVARLSVFRLPLRDMSSSEDAPEIRADLHIKLLGWMKYRAYSKPDADTRNERLAAEGLAAFEQEFGKKAGIWSEEFDARHLPADDMDGSF